MYCGLCSAAERENMVKQGQYTLCKAAVSTVLYPLVHVKVLFQLGYEPFPLSSGKLFWKTREAYFLPNALVYGKKIFKQYGWTALYTGIGASLASQLANGVAVLASTAYIDQFYQKLGGEPVNLEKNEIDMSEMESFRRVLRSAVRESIVRIVGIIVSRPFTVVMIRQIAQIVGDEVKYGNVFASLRLIGLEEGPRGLFSGLIPQILADCLSIAGIHVVTFAIERIMVPARQCANREGNQGEAECLDGTRKLLTLVAPILVNSLTYPFQVVSTVMAVTGSGLAIAILPYSPPFGIWYDAWDYLKPNQGLQRGARLFLREYVGAITVGSDQEVYASNKHFV